MEREQNLVLSQIGSIRNKGVSKERAKLFFHSKFTLTLESSGLDVSQMVGHPYHPDRVLKSVDDIYNLTEIEMMSLEK